MAQIHRKAKTAISSHNKMEQTVFVSLEGTLAFFREISVLIKETNNLYIASAS